MGGLTVVCLGVERVIAITWPLRAKGILTFRFSVIEMIVCTMECAIGRASRAMALQDFKVVGPAIHLALPNLFLKLSTYLNIFINIFIFFKVNHLKKQ